MAEGIRIDQFMWTWQIHYRISIETLMTMALESVMASSLDPEIIMVGFTDVPGARHPICIEPESGPVQPSHLAELHELAGRLYDEDPDRQIFHSHPDVAAIRDAQLRGRTRGMAIAQLVEASGVMSDRHLLFSSGAKVGDFIVHVGVALDRGQWNSLPRMEGDMADGWPTPEGLVDEVVRLVLAEANAGLRSPSPKLSRHQATTPRHCRRGGPKFRSGLLLSFWQLRAQVCVRRLQLDSRGPYEGSGAAGRFLLAKPNHSALHISGRLENSVSLSSTRAVRKLLETTGPECALLIGDGVYGFGRVNSNEVMSDVFEIEITGHAEWELRNSGTTLTRVSYGRPALAHAIFNEAAVLDTLLRVFGDAADLSVLIGLISAATNARHGTTLVVSSGAERESRPSGARRPGSCLSV